VSFMTLQAVAQDMSTWSDKTICRLVKSGEGQDHIDEASSRGIFCGGSASLNKVKAPEASQNIGLQSIQVPSQWVPIKNHEVFDQERSLMAQDMDYRLHFIDDSTLEDCTSTFLNWPQSMIFETTNKADLNQEMLDRTELVSSLIATSGNMRQSISTCTDYMAQLHGFMGVTPNIYKAILLKWANEDLLVLPNKSDHHFAIKMYNTGAVLGLWASYYAVYSEEFDFTSEERTKVESYLVTKLKKIDVRNGAEKGKKACSPYSQNANIKGLSDGTIDGNTCGSTLWKVMIGQISLGLKLADPELFQAGVENNLFQFKFFDETGIFVPYAAGKGAHALAYQNEITAYLSILTELYATVGYDLLEHHLDNGIQVKDIFKRLIEIVDDRMILWKYAKLIKSYGEGPGATPTSDYKKWTKEEGWRFSATSKREIIRESARYIDTYRPDLEPLREHNFVERHPNYEVNKLSIMPHTSFHMIEGYKLYEANTKKGVDKTAWSAVGNSIIKNSKVKNAQDLAYAVDQGYDHQENYLLQTGIDNHAGKYKLHWYFLNINCKSNCSNDYQGQGTLTLADGIGKFKPKYGQPSANLRKMLTVYYDKDGSIAVSGTLDLWEKERAYPTLLKGNLADSSTVSGIWEEGDTVGFRFEKVE
jgi:hypothetical protein